MKFDWRWAGITIVCLIVIGLLLGKAYCGKPNGSEQGNTVEVPIKPDTVYRPEYIPIVDTLYTPIPPNLVTKYLADEKAKLLAKWRKQFNDSLNGIEPGMVIIGDDEEPDTLQVPYLYQGYFSKDTISLAIYGKELQLKTYQVDYSKYNYLFQGDSILRIAKTPITIGITPTIKKSIFTTESYITSTINPLDKNIRARIDYSILYKNYGLYTEASYETKNKLGYIGIGFKVKLK